ncbi:MAG: YggT family protein [Ruminococcaceae bacterium]|nr:YggT family protein [Oscillospiraceae bacterium]
MELFAMILINTVNALLSVIEICMLVRAVLSFLPIKDDNPFLLFTVMVTEPIIAPIRALFEHFGWFRNLPIDISFLVGCVLLSVVSTLLMVLV